MHWEQKTCKVDSFCFNFHRNKRGPTYCMMLYLVFPTVSIGLRDAAIPTCSNWRQTLSCTSHIKHLLWLIEVDEKRIAFLSKFTAKKHVLHSTGLYGRSSSPITILYLPIEICVKDSSNSCYCTWYFPYLAIWEFPPWMCLSSWMESPLQQHRKYPLYNDLIACKNPHGWGHVATEQSSCYLLGSLPKITGLHGDGMTPDPL